MDIGVTLYTSRENTKIEQSQHGKDNIKDKGKNQECSTRGIFHTHSHVNKLHIFPHKKGLHIFIVCP